MIRWMILLAVALMGSASAEDKKMGYVLKGPTKTNQYIVFNDKRYFACVTRKRCTALTESVPFYTALGFTRSKELIDYVGHDHELRSCMLRECKEH